MAQLHSSGENGLDQTKKLSSLLSKTDKCFEKLPKQLCKSIISVTDFPDYFVSKSSLDCVKQQNKLETKMKILKIHNVRTLHINKFQIDRNKLKTVRTKDSHARMEFRVNRNNSVSFASLFQFIWCARYFCKRSPFLIQLALKINSQTQFPLKTEFQRNCS